MTSSSSSSSSTAVKKRRGVSLPIRRFFSVYHIAHVMMFVSYCYIRQVLLPQHNPAITVLNITEPDTTHETQVFFLYLMFLITRIRKSMNIESFARRVYFYNVFLILFSFYITEWRLSVVFGFVYLLLFFAVESPWFQGNSNVEQMIPQDFLKIEIDQSEMYYLVQVMVPWSNDCVDFSYNWARLSLRFRSPKLKFITINVAKNQSLADKLLVDTGYMSNELPTLMLFQKGKRIARLPDVGGGVPSVNGSPASGPGVASMLGGGSSLSQMMTETYISTFFDLERLAGPLPAAIDAPASNNKKKKEN